MRIAYLLILALIRRCFLLLVAIPSIGMLLAVVALLAWLNAAGSAR